MMSLNGSIPRIPYGKFPSVSINRDRTIVEVHQPSMVNNTIYYQIGTIVRDRALWTGEDKIDAGKFAKVAVDGNTCVVAHEGKLLRRIYYHIGTLDDDNRSISWDNQDGKPQLVDWGRLPAVAIQGNYCVITFDSAHLRYTSHYFLGVIERGGNRPRIIRKVKKEKLFHSAVTETSVAMNGNYVLAAGRGWYTILCRFGEIEEDNQTAHVKWMTEFRFNTLGYCPNICIDDDGYVIMNWQSLTLRRLYHVIGTVVVNEGVPSITWKRDTKTCYDYGYNPTIALSQNGIVVEEHETNYAKYIRCTLHYSLGTLNKDHAGQRPPAAHQNDVPGGQGEQPGNGAPELNNFEDAGNNGQEEQEIAM